MTDPQNIAEAIELYGESAVSDLIAKNGNYQEIITLLSLQFEIQLLKIAKYETKDGTIFFKKRKPLFVYYGN